jgi:hypothetical protein
LNAVNNEKKKVQDKVKAQKCQLRTKRLVKKIENEEGTFCFLP